MRKEKRTEITGLSHSSWLKYSNSVTLKVLIRSAEELRILGPSTCLAGLRLLFKRLEHALIRVVRSARAGRQAGKVVTNTNVRSAGIIRHCPICHSQMIKR